MFANWTRRNFLRGISLGVPTLSLSRLAFADVRQPLGVQLYTVRNLAEQNLAGVLPELVQYVLILFKFDRHHSAPMLVSWSDVHRTQLPDRLRHAPLLRATPAPNPAYATSFKRTCSPLRPAHRAYPDHR